MPHFFGVVLIAYLAVAYFLLPQVFIFLNRKVELSSAEMVTRTPDGIAGDPINVGLVGEQTDILRAFAAAGWDTADAITLKSSLEITGSVLFGHPYPDAPVSALLYDGRKQDLAFEKPIGDSADRRHHVRFWRATQAGPDGRPVWLGAASFDQGVGLSHDTGQVTHHIAPDLDADRGDLMADLTRVGWVDASFTIEGVGATHDGRNGGGDPYFTDGKALIGVLRAPGGN